MAANLALDAALAQQAPNTADRKVWYFSPGEGGRRRIMLYTILIIIAVIVLAVIVLNVIRSGGRSV